MKLLIIKDRGLVIRLPGFIVRTPAQVDVSNIDIHRVMLELKRSGARQYEIKSGDDLHEKEKTKKKKYLIEDESEEKGIDNDYSEVMLKIEGMQDLLYQLLESSTKSEDLRISNIEKLLKHIVSDGLRTTSDKESRDNFNKKSDPDDDIFIPSIDTGRFKLSGGQIHKQKQNTRDITNVVEALKKGDKQND